MNRMEEIRARASALVVALLWVNASLVLARAFIGTEASSTVLSFGALAIAGSATALWASDRTGAATRFTTGAAHAALVGLLVYGFAGSPLQIDMHMYFFAMLAVLTMWVDWRPIAAFTAVTAVHHLLLYVALPAAVFPGTSDFSRVALHAVILLVEAGMLYRITRIIERSLNESEEALQATVEAQEQSNRLSVEAEEARTARDAESRRHALAKAQEAERMQDAVARLGAGLTRLADGDLTVQLNEPFAGTLDQLRIDFNQSVDKLRASLEQIKDSAQSIDRSATDMRASSDNLSKRTEQQAASLEETSAAFEEITASVRRASTSAQEAASMVSNASASTDKSRTVVMNAVEAMNRIEETSSEIGTITDLIDGIAFQTNLLALNAGVEAARAGEAGRGFAVVAQEVRALAQRAASAATDIKALIHKSGEEVQNGVSLVSAAGSSLDEIAAHVTHINERIVEIAGMARNQASSLNEVAASVTQIDQITQKNAAMAGENTNVMRSLAQDATNLSSLVGQFTLDRAAHGLHAVDADEQPVASPARQMLASVAKAFSRG